MSLGSTLLAVPFLFSRLESMLSSPPARLRVGGDFSETLGKMSPTGDALSPACLLPLCAPDACVEYVSVWYVSRRCVRAAGDGESSVGL